MVECPESIEGLQELEALLPLCRVTLYEQAKARIEKGVAKSVSEASRQIAEETDRSPETIRTAINRENKKQGVSLTHITETEKFKPLKKPPPVALGEKEILEKAKEIRAEKREQTKEERIQRFKEAPPIPSNKYRIIYADPPWSYNDKCEEGAIQSGGVETHYPTMTINELCSMEIKSKVGDNAVLFLWTTSPLLEESFEVINAWGFKYKASFVWDKIKHNKISDREG